MDFLQNNRLALHLLAGIFLAIIYPMQELFSGNQNIYFLWGMADMLPNTFDADPLHSSPDPYPLFSWLISVFPIEFLGVWTTILYTLLNSVYSFSLFGIADRIGNIYRDKSRLFSFTALFLLLHCAPIWGTFAELIFDMDFRWMWDSGIAEQGVLRGYLQPSVFGVFLLLSLSFAMRENYTAAIWAVAPAAVFHANYLFLGAVLTATYLVLSRCNRSAMIASVILLILCLPYAHYVLEHFVLINDELKTAVDKAVAADAPNNPHLNPSNWINPKFIIQLIILFLGSSLIWKSKSRNVFLSVLIAAIGLSAIAFAFDNTTLISLNPWRLSILLIPTASVILSSRLVSSSFWSVLSPIIFGAVGASAISLVYFRFFGNSSAQFLANWYLILGVLILTSTIAVAAMSGNQTLKRAIAPLVILALIVVGFTDRHIETQSKNSQQQFMVIDQLKMAEPNTVYIIPTSWTSFRMNAQKAVFTDENLVYGPALPALLFRLEMVRMAELSGDYSDIVSAIPTTHQVKLIAPSDSEIPAAAEAEKLTDHYACYTLRN